MAKILIAEDDNAMLNFLTLALRRAGHEVVAATDGHSAMNAIKKTDNFNLLLTDIVMPGMDGLELSKKARELRPKIKIMFITGFAAMIMEHESKTKNQNEHMLSKPFHLNDLVTKVEELLKE